MTLSGKTAFVTGGSGFIGGRLIHSLIVDHAVRVRALLNRATSAFHIANLPVEFAEVPITDATAVATACAGCDFIFHLAYGKGTPQEQRHITVEGTRAIARAALANKVTRLVNVSTAAVYGETPDGVVDERALRHPSGWPYADTKREAEEVVADFHRRHGLPATTLQLAGVYGPWGSSFTIEPLRTLRSGRVVLVNGGDGIANATFVDDVVQALLLAAVRDEANGETFLVKGPGRVTRREMYEAYQAMLGVDSIMAMTPSEIRRARRGRRKAAALSLLPSAVRSLRASSEFRSAVSEFRSAVPGGGYIMSPRRLSAILPGSWRARMKSAMRREATDSETAGAPGDSDRRPLILPPEHMVKRLAAKTEFSSAKAQRLLGYEPRYDLAAGMALTELWARWVRLV